MHNLCSSKRAEMRLKNHQSKGWAVIHICVDFPTGSSDEKLRLFFDMYA
jgi:hypothetical protein